MQTEIESRGAAGSREHGALVDVKDIRVEADLWMPPAHGIDKAPVGRGPAAVEELRLSEDHDTVRLAAGHVALDVNKHPEHDPQCGGMQWFHPLSTGTQAALGQTQRHMFTGSSLGTKWSDPFKRSAFFGTFAY